MKSCCECEVIKKEVGRSVKQFGFFKQNRGRDRREMLIENAHQWKIHFSEGQMPKELLLMGTKWGRNNTASLGQPLMMGVNVPGHLSVMEILGDCTYVLLLALGRLASSLHAHSVASIVDIPSISHWQNGSLSWITSLWKALIGSLIQRPRREKGPLVARHSSAY